MFLKRTNGQSPLRQNMHTQQSRGIEHGAEGAVYDLLRWPLSKQCTYSLSAVPICDEWDRRCGHAKSRGIQKGGSRSARRFAAGMETHTNSAESDSASMCISRWNGTEISINAAAPSIAHRMASPVWIRRNKSSSNGSALRLLGIGRDSVCRQRHSHFGKA